MESTLQSTIAMIDRVLGYVRQVLSGEVEGNEKIGKYLLDALSESSGAEGQLESSFNAHLQVISIFSVPLRTWTNLPIFVQDTLMVSYLASLVRSQVEVSTRLALVA